MKKLRLKSILSMMLAVCLMMCSSVVCFASEGNTSLAWDESITGEGRAIPTYVDDGTITRSGNLTDIRYATVTENSANFGGQVTVPANESGSLIKIFWRGSPQSGANSSAMFKLTVSGNGINKIVYLPGNDSTASYSIANLPAGTYDFNISKYTNVKGTYVCCYQFYAY